ncbi:TPA: hypothetical protein I7730_14030 [Vibrio vulnificus]|uniref:Uncharacterized protein n=1 Tax=Vibrio vulnificus TaxID=672 RepID=A0A8H9N184_VIBVL|nr:hypothetical protein [Vibrio vulnificus]HAS8540904.1 hypothetical protein [Vibrio vulnificus]
MENKEPVYKQEEYRPKIALAAGRLIKLIIAAESSRHLKESPDAIKADQNAITTKFKSLKRDMDVVNKHGITCPNLAKLYVELEKIEKLAENCTGENIDPEVFLVDKDIVSKKIRSVGKALANAQSHPFTCPLLSKVNTEMEKLSKIVVQYDIAPADRKHIVREVQARLTSYDRKFKESQQNQTDQPLFSF